MFLLLISCIEISALPSTSEDMVLCSRIILLKSLGNNTFTGIIHKINFQPYCTQPHSNFRLYYIVMVNFIIQRLFYIVIFVHTGTMVGRDLLLR